MKFLDVKNGQSNQHILPNVMRIALISVVPDFSSLVLAEAVLSYYLVVSVAVFVFMFALVPAANLFADTVWDAFNTRRDVK
jgi:peptide/nickel transport system permease protein